MMISKIKYFVCTAGLMLLSHVGFAHSEMNDKFSGKSKMDTSAVLLKTDSLATSILKIYDENSLRQTGVPLSVEHYDKTVFFNTEQNNVYVSYSFSKAKFYGPKSDGIVMKDLDKYPFHFDVILDLETNTTRSGKLVENK